VPTGSNICKAPLGRFEKINPKRPMADFSQAPGGRFLQVSNGCFLIEAAIGSFHTVSNAGHFVGEANCFKMAAELAFITYHLLAMITRGEGGALPRKCHSLTCFCNSGGYLPYIFL
jgi:hypothetical protein